MHSMCPEETLGESSMGGNLASEVFEFQATKSPIVFSKIRSMRLVARFAEKWEEQLQIFFFLVFALNIFGRCLQELDLRVRKNSLEKLAEKKSAFNHFIGLRTIFMRLLLPKLQYRRPEESSDGISLLEKTVLFFSSS